MSEWLFLSLNNSVQFLELKLPDWPKVRFRFKLKTLLALTTLIGLVTAYYVSIWSEVTDQRSALEGLRRRGFVVTVRYESFNPNPIGFWRSTKQAVSWPWHTISGETIPLIRGCHLDVAKDTLVTPTLAGAGIDDLNFLTSFQTLEWVTIHYPITAQEVDLMGSLPRLRDVDLMEAKVGEQLIDSLLQLEHLEEVTFGEGQISKASFDRCCDAGLEVTQYGIYDRRRGNDFLKYGNVDYHIDSKASELAINIFGPSGQCSVGYRLNLRTCPDRYTEDIENVGIDCELDRLTGGWNELVGKRFPMKPKLARMIDNFLNHRGVWIDVAEMSYQIKAREKDRFHIVGTFVLANQTQADVDGWFPVVKVSVYLNADDSVSQGAEVLQQAGFDPARFGQPVYRERYHCLVYPVDLSTD